MNWFVDGGPELLGGRVLGQVAALGLVVVGAGLVLLGLVIAFAFSAAGGPVG